MEPERQRGLAVGEWGGEPFMTDSWSETMGVQNKPHALNPRQIWGTSTIEPTWSSVNANEPDFSILDLPLRGRVSMPVRQDSDHKAQTVWGQREHPLSRSNPWQPVSSPSASVRSVVRKDSFDEWMPRSQDVQQYRIQPATQPLRRDASFPNSYDNGVGFQLYAPSLQVASNPPPTPESEDSSNSDYSDSHASPYRAPDPRPSYGIPRIHVERGDNGERQRRRDAKQAARLKRKMRARISVPEKENGPYQGDDPNLPGDVINDGEAKLQLSIATTLEYSVVLKLQFIFQNSTAMHYKQLLKCVGADAQTILDNFQYLLDADKFPDRGQLMVAMRRLSAKTGLYPQRYVLNGPLQLIDYQPVGSGRFADIYRARFQGQIICLKVIKAYDSYLVQHMAKIYAREAILWGQLSHPNLLPFYGLHTFRSQIAFVAPYAERGNLRQYLTNVPHANRVLLCTDTAAGVKYLHANEIVHGDLKTMNVLVDESGRGCLADFGISGVIDKEIIQWTSQSAAASKGGTTRWQAPELHDPEAEDIVHNTKESDVFAWASTGYEIFTGTVPYSNIANETKVALKIHQGVLPTRPPDDDLSWSRHGLTEVIWQLFHDCWSRLPASRPTMSEVVSRLENEQPTDSRPPAQWDGAFARRFRNAGLSPSMVDLDIILSRMVDESFKNLDAVDN